MARQDANLQKIQEVKERVASQLMANPNITGVGIGYKIINGRRTDEIGIRVYVSKKRPLQELAPQERIPATIEGVSVDVIEATFESFLNGTALEDHKMRQDPLVGGISISRLDRDSAGTLGAWAINNDTGEIVLLSNWHVLCGRPDCAVGDMIVQPGVLDGGDSGAVIARLERWVINSDVDAAIARLTGARSLLQEALGLGTISDVAEPFLGMRVRKSGRTTGVTEGTVTDISADVTVGYSDGILRTFQNQIVIENGEVGDRGDSGSVWIDDSNWLVGLLFAGSGTERIIANPMLTVLDNLRISIGLSIVDLIAISNL